MDDGGRGKPVDISCPVVTYSRLVCDSLLSDRNLCVFRNLSAKVTFSGSGHHPDPIFSEVLHLKTVATDSYPKTKIRTFSKVWPT